MEYICNNWVEFDTEPFDPGRNKEALKKLIFDYGCYQELDYTDDKAYELTQDLVTSISLVSLTLYEGHEREFTICNLISYIYGIQNNPACFSALVNIDGLFKQLERLPMQMREIILGVFYEAFHTHFIDAVEKAKYEELDNFRKRREKPRDDELIYDIYGEVEGTPVSASNLEFDEMLRSGMFDEHIERDKILIYRDPN